MALSYIGGKSRIGLWIRNYIPTDIETYVESFSGMFWVFFKMELPNYKNLKTVVYNDFNPLNVNLFNCIVNYTDFYEVIKITNHKTKNFLIVSKRKYFIQISK